MTQSYCIVACQEKENKFQNKRDLPQSLKIIRKRSLEINLEFCLYRILLFSQSRGIFLTCRILWTSFVSEKLFGTVLQLIYFVAFYLDFIWFFYFFSHTLQFLGLSKKLNYSQVNF